MRLTERRENPQTPDRPASRNHIPPPPEQPQQERNHERYPLDNRPSIWGVKLHRVPWRVVAARLVVNGLAVALVVLILPGVRESSGHPVLGYLLLGAIFGLINAFVKPAIQFVSLPLLAGSMGLVIVLVDIVTFALLDAFTNVLTTSGAVSVVAAGMVLGVLSYLLDNLLGLVPPIVPDQPQKAWTR